MSSAFCNYVLWSVIFTSLLPKTINNSIKILLTLFHLKSSIYPYCEKGYNSPKFYDFQYLNKNISSTFKLPYYTIYKSNKIGEQLKELWSQMHLCLNPNSTPS